MNSNFTRCIRLFRQLSVLVFLLTLGTLSLSYTQYNLEDVLQIASKKSEDLAIINESYEADKQQINTFKASVYPQIFFSTEGSYFWNSTKAFGAMTSIFSPPDTGSTSSASPTSKTPSSRYDGMDYNWTFGLEQPVFTFGRLSVVARMAKTQTKLLGKQKELQREQFFVGVVQAFNNAVLAQVEVEVAENSKEMAKKFYASLEIDYQSGACPKIDYLQGKALLAQTTAELQMAITQKEVLINRLKIVIGMKKEDSLHLNLGKGLYPEKFYSKLPDLSVNKTRILALKEEQFTLAKDQVKYDKANLYPSLSLFGLFSNQFTWMNRDGVNNPGLRATVDNDFFNYRIGLRLNWTLFDGFRNYSSYKRSYALANVEKRNVIKMQKQDEVQLSEAKKLVIASAEGVQAAATAMEVATMVFEQAKSDLKAGAINISQYISIEKQFKQSKLLYHRAMARELLSHINLKMASGVPVF